MTNKEIAKWLRDKKCNFFAEESSGDINKIPEKYSGSDKTISAITMGITCNTVLEGLAKEIEEE